MVELSTKVNIIQSGMSQVFGALLHKLFASNGFNLSTHGVLLTGMNGVKFRLFAACKWLLQDGAAHKSVWHCKGDDASKLCMLCKHVMTQECNLVEEYGSSMLTCNVIKKADLELAVAGDLRRQARYLSRRAPPANSIADFNAMEQALGMTHQPGSILLDRELDHVVDPVDHYLHDVMHCLFVHGVCNVIIYLLLEELITAGMKDIYEQLENFLQLWEYPRRVHGNGLPDNFSEARKKNTERHITLSATHQT